MDISDILVNLHDLYQQTEDEQQTNSEEVTTHSVSLFVSYHQKHQKTKN